MSNSNSNIDKKQGGASPATTGGGTGKVEEQTVFVAGVSAGGSNGPDRDEGKTAMVASEQDATSIMPDDQKREETGGKTSRTGTDTGSVSRSTSSSWGDPDIWSKQDSKRIETGTIIKDRFELIELVGEGGMGMVFKAIDRRKLEALDRNPYLAIKILNEEFKKHPESLKALQREARKAQDLAHPNIVTVFDFDREGSMVFMTMEFMEGESLKQVIKKNPSGLPFHEAIHIINGMCQGLSYAHTKGIIHSDFKPGNVFITRQKQIKIFDFGIARAAKAKESEVERGEKTLFDASTLGALTPAYASPEMFDGAPPAYQDDIYALACITYELYTGKHPFINDKNEKERSDVAKKKGIVPKRPRILNRRQWKGMCSGLAFEREKRTPSATQFFETQSVKKSWLPLILGTTGAAMAIVGLLFGKDIVQTYWVWQIKSQVLSGNDSEIATAIQRFDTIDIKKKEQVVAEEAIRDNLISYFERNAKEFFDPDRRKFDYQKALEIWAKAKAMPTIRDSTKLKDIISQSEEKKNKLILELSQRYNDFLAQGKVLPLRDEEDVFDILESVQLLDPNQAVLKDHQLVGVYVRETQKVMNNNELDKAENFINKGLLVFGDNVEIINLKDKLANLKHVHDEQSEIVRLEAGIRNNLTQARAMKEFAGFRDDLQRLRELRPEHVLLTQVEKKILTILDQELQPAISSRAWPEGETLLENAKLLVGEAALQVRYGQLQKARDSFERQVDLLYDRFTAAVDANRLNAPAGNNATAFLEELEKNIPGDSRLQRAYSKIAQAYLGLSRSARNNSKWDEAHGYIDLALKLKIDEAMMNSLMQERDGIALAQKMRIQELQATQEEQAQLARERTEQEKAKNEKERQERISNLYAEFERSLDKMASKEKSATKVLIILDQLEMINPGDSLLAEGRIRIEERFLRDSKTLRDGGKPEEAIRTIKEGLRVFPKSAALTDTSKEYEQLVADNKARQQRERLENVRAEADKLIAAAQLTSDWDSKLQGKLKEMSSLSDPDDAWLKQANKSIAELFLHQAAKMREEKRFSEAYTMLDKGGRYDPGNADLKKERQALTADEKVFQDDASRKTKLAELESRKQILITQAQANEVEQAQSTLSRLKGELPNDDPFMLQDAPQAIAGAYFRLAEKRSGKGDPEEAVKLANLGLEFNRSAMDLQKALERYKKQLAERKKEPSPPVPAPAPIDQKTLAPPPEIKESPASKSPIVIEKGPQSEPRQETAAKPKEEEKRIAAYSPETVSRTAGLMPSDKPCTSEMAGRGGVGKGVCYDMVGDTEKGPYLVVVPPGEGFNRPFAITKFEVSIKDYNIYCQKSGNCEPITAGRDELPVSGISIQEAKNYSHWLTTVTGNTYRLPLDGEWVYAAQADGKDKDKDLVTDYNYFLQQGGRTLKGGGLLAVNSGGKNSWGLQNYKGNVQEWVETSAGIRVRGGNYKDSSSTCDISLIREHSGQADGLTGFRLIRDISK